jgi:hypothetical protein
MSSKPDLVSDQSDPHLSAGRLASHFIPWVTTGKFEGNPTKNSCMYQYYIFLLIIWPSSGSMNYKIPIKQQDKQCTYNATLRRVGVTTVAVKSNKNYILHMSVALFIQHAKCMRRVIISSVVCLAQQYFSTLSHKRHTFLYNFCLKHFSF